MLHGRTIESILRAPPFHWVGDGFRVANYFPSGAAIGTKLSPFLFLDYHPPLEYTPTNQPRGVGPHPHRGFETVTLAFEGAIAHHDSAGGGGVIGPGDAQWMTAGSGVLHKEYHEETFARRGGRLHMLQLWVNLPKAHKMAPPAYQAIKSEERGRHELPDGAGTVFVLAGQFEKAKGPAKTFTPIELWESSLRANGTMSVSLPVHHNVGLLVMSGEVTLNGSTPLRATEFAVFSHDHPTFTLRAVEDAHLVLLAGEPIADPVVQHGPFVMNTEKEIRQAILDFNVGKFGHLE